MKIILPKTEVGNKDLTKQEWIKTNFGQHPFTYTPPSGFKALSNNSPTSLKVSTNNND